MRRHFYQEQFFLRKIAITTILLLINFSFSVYAQNQPVNFVGNTLEGLNSTNSFIENIGQYGDKMKGHESMGKILYAYEGLGMPVLFTPHGLVHLQRKAEKISKEEEREMERKGIPEEIIEHKKKVTERAITVKWIDANPNPEIVAENKTDAYHTYYTQKDKAYGYRLITYKNLYPGIDLQYHFNTGAKKGFEYSFIVKPGADISKIRMKYEGDVQSLEIAKKGNLIVSSDINGIEETVPVSYYAAEPLPNKKNEVPVKFNYTGNTVYFEIAGNYDDSKTLIIDPFVTATTSLTGLNAGKAKDVDYDYAGNIYVTGGGDGSSTHQLAKFNAAGALQWTFNGSLSVPSWTFGTYWGGWMVEKPTGNIFLGQGFQYFTGFSVIRISTTGLYDNFITTPNQNFTEAWKMLWNCNGGGPRILVAGGGINSNINFGVFSPPSTTVSSLNVTGIAYTGGGGWAQDIIDFIIDPSNNDMYTLYGSLYGTPALNRQIYKNTAPYSAASVAWNLPSGFATTQEIQNRPYLLGLIDNSANIFAVNASYLYYWDGKNLKAFNKATGATVGTPLVTAGVALMSGGIVADACNNVFVGSGNGTIKVYRFTGSVFDDAAVPDISIAGFGTRSVYDLAYDESRKLIYASGDGFAGSFDVATYCPNTLYTLAVTPNCAASSANVIVSPTPPSGSVVTYTLYNGTAQVASNTTGVFSGISPNITYTIVATINLACSGSQASTNFTLPGPTVNAGNITVTNSSCGANSGSITATASGGTTPYSFSIDGVNFQPGGTFSGLAAGVYTVTVRDASGCKTTRVVTITNTNGPTLSFTSVNAECGSNNASITASATAGAPPYQYSINGTTFQVGNFFTGILAGTYTLTVRDANGCTNALPVTITSSPAPQLNAIPQAATCGSNNGSITVFGSGGTGALQYSVNGNTYQAGTVFSGLTPGPYTVYVKDANGCIATMNVIIPNAAAPTLTGTSTPAACGNNNGTITVTGTGGVAPYQYSINGVVFQAGNIFSGLAPGSYTITIRDNTGCTNITTVTVASSGGPSVTATTTPASCNTSNGSITATASGGTGAGYQFSINGSTYQASNTFAGLAAGNYVVYVRDGGGCIGTVQVTISSSAAPSVTAVSTPTACGSNTGTITATGTGGTGGLQYSINGSTYQASNVFSGLAGGTYTVYVRDANGCVKTTTVTVANASGLGLSVATISSSCSSNTGTITATATGGIGLLQYSINGTTYQGSGIFNGVAPGTYTVYVRDANGCIITQQAVVGSSAGPQLTANYTNATCTGGTGTITLTGSGGVAPLQYSINGITYFSSGIFTGVAPGTYTVYVKDAANCITSQTVTITSSGGGPGIGNFTVRVDDAYFCNGGLGKITHAEIDGNTCSNCMFSLNGGPFIPEQTQLFTNLAPGVYTVTVQDINGCTKTISVTIGIGVPSTATATVTGTACGTSNGTITITGIGPNTPYHASINGIGGPWIDFDPSHTFTGLAPGVYTIILSDDESFDPGPPVDPGGCLDTIYVTVPATGGINIATTVTNGTCGQNGSVQVTGSAGTGPYTYSINGGAYVNNGGLFTNLAAGSYTVSVRDNNGCTTGTTVTIISPAVPTVTAVTIPASCGLNNGTITATGTGGTAPLQYSITGTSFQSSNIFNNLQPRNYTLFVKDANNCYSSINVTVANSGMPVISAYSIAAVCGVNNGSIVTTGSGGVPPYVFSINGTVYQSSNTFSNLAAGFYTVYIRDAGGCVSTSGVSVTNPGGPVINNVTTTATTCGNPNGSITVTASGGTGTLQYSIDGINFQALNSFASLASGTYTITVRDASGCVATRTVLLSNTNGPQTLTAVVVPAACGLNNGTITATASGGVGALQYSINGTTYQASNIFNAVGAGTYTLYVRDANSCIRTLPVTVINLPGPTLTATSSPASCGLSDGTITANATGGTGTLQYSINGGVTYQASNIFTGLAAGPYTIIVRDARGCSATVSVTVNTAGSAVAPTFTAVAPICSGQSLAALPTTSNNGITGTWSPALSNTATTTYTFTPTVGQCATTTTLTITVNSNVTPTFTAVAPICSGQTLTALPTTSNNGITGTWSPALNNTATTTYTFTPTAGQCATSTTLTITVNSNVTPTFTAVAPICSGQTLTALPTTSNNGITGTWAPALNNTATTTYTFTPTAGQCATTTTLTITVNPNVTPTFTAVTPICSGGTLTALPTTSNNGITGTWSPALNNTTTTTYTFTPAAGQCATATTLTITVNPNVTPIFTAVPAICSGQTLTALPTTSNNGITGTWAPALNNTATTTYTFTPTAGQCATATTLTIAVNPNVTPTFTAVPAICSGQTLTALPTTSNNGITGTWSPALNNTATTTYTFTPTAGQCATTTTLTITINPNVTSIFTAVAPICSGQTLTALPTISNNGITGTWSPALNNTTTTTYTFTPAAGQCATATTLTITVNPNVTPTFIAVAPICSGQTLTALPTTSLNGITGTWSPALNNIATTTYTFTPTAGQCATATTLTIAVNPNVTPTFTAVAPICSSQPLAALPTTSNNGITGTWSPALNNTATTTYTFTPAAGQCATSATLTITVNPILSPTVNCGSSTTSSVSFTWAAVVGATGYNVVYQVNANAPVNVGSIGNVLIYQVTGLASGDNVSITITPIGGAGTCFAPSSVSCTATACTPPTANISYASPYCNNLTGPQLVTLTGTGAFTGGTFSSTAGLTINSSTGTITPSTSTAGTYIVTYTVAASGGCPGVIATTSVTIDPLITPSFNPVASICSGAILTALPTTSLNGITGTWSPALNNTATTTYTFTPIAGQCAITTSMTIAVNPAVLPAFNTIGTICQFSTAPVLPGTSNNGITGTWTPATINTSITGTTTYTFTPTAGQCASAVNLPVTVATQITALFTQINPLCLNAAAPSLPLTSNNGITGTWSPAAINTSAIGTTVYTFTPAAGQCATATVNMSITVTNSIIPAFNAVAPICSGGILTALPGTSINGVTGSWSPALNNTATTTYTFSPNTGQCATTTTLTITVNSTVTPTFNAVPAICSGQTLAALPTTSLNAVAGTWSPALNNTTTTTYTFTPAVGQCATTATLTITVNPTVTPTFSAVAPICSGATLSSLPTTSLNGITGTWTPVMNNTATTTYTFTPTTGQCATSTALSITVNSIPATPAVNIVQPGCAVQSGTVTLTSAVAGLLFSLDGGAYAAYPVGGYTGLAPGTHTLTAQNPSGCTSPIRIITIDALVASPGLTAVPTSTTCTGNTGTITATASGGSSPYRYSINGINFQNSNLFTGLAANTYTVTVKDANNCTGTVSVTIGFNNNLTVNAGTGKTICEGETVQLAGSTNAASYSWSPATGLSSATVLNPTASPRVTTDYTLTATTGVCTSTSTVTIFVKPAPVPNAGPDQKVCNGQAVQLHGSGGAAYQWSPASNLSDASSPNPVINTDGYGNLVYYLDVLGSNGCRSLKKDTVNIRILAPVMLFAGNDTAAAINQSLQLNATDIFSSGLQQFTWSPGTGLSNPGIKNPVFAMGTPGTYTYNVSAVTADKCPAQDEITIVVYLRPEILVPNAFTPGNGGPNDIFRPILRGMKRLINFSVFNRYGELVYFTAEQGKGWDGIYKGLPQNIGAYVWVAEALDYTGKIHKKKGSVVLIR